MLTLRPVALPDVDALSEMYVRSWQNAYDGLVPEESLGAMDVEQHAANWRGRLANPHPERYSLLAEFDDGTVGGFVTYGSYRRDHDPKNLDARLGGEVYAIYVDPERWGGGTGHALMEAAIGHLRALGWLPVQLWALSGNQRAARFYRRHGFALDGTRGTYEFNGSKLPILRYVLSTG